MTCSIKAQAKKEGKVRYFTGKPCANGHIVERNTHTGRCVECNRLRMRRYWDENPDAVEKRNQMLQGYKFRNPENYAKYQEEKSKRWYTDEEYRTKLNEKSKEANIVRYQDPEYKAKRSQQGKEWFKNNAGIARAKRARRRASMSNATPNWLTAIQKAQIAEFYEIAEALNTQTGVKHHVDHIVPLKGKSVTGLHNPWNLQILTATQNISKGNRYEL